VAVAGVDRNGNHSKVSVSGPEVVLAAPSDDISSTNAGGGYRVGTGTSDATAIVAGAVALVRSRFPQMKAPEVIRRLTATAIDKGPPGRDNDYGYGIVNLVGALTADLPTEAASTKPPPTPAPEKAQFRWWLIALPVAVVVAALTFGIWRRRRTTRSRTGTPST
jgi:subtilisin family serine protease